MRSTHTLQSNIFSRLGLKKKPLSTSVTFANKPTFTGSGPFVELPQFNPIGSPSTLLNVTLPASSSLNIRSGSTVALDGSLLSLSSTDKLLHGTSYQQLRSNSPVSLIINGNSENYSIIDIKDKEEKWVILHDQNLISWTGFSLELSPIKVLLKYRTFESKGKGTLVVDGDSQLFDIELKVNEEISLNPNAFVATSISSDKIRLEVLKRSAYKLPNLLPNFFSKVDTRLGLIGGVLNPIRGVLDKGRLNYNKAIDAITSKEVVTAWNQIKHHLSTSNQFVQVYVLSYILNTKPITFRLQGPGRVLFNNNGQVSQRAFTRQEIYDINRH